MHPLPEIVTKASGSYLQYEQLVRFLVVEQTQMLKSKHRKRETSHYSNAKRGFPKSIKDRTVQSITVTEVLRVLALLKL